MRDLHRRLLSESVGTAFLVITVVGSGLTAERFAADRAVALFGSSAATGAMLFAIISLFKPLSGAHFNPVITLVAALRQSIVWRDAWLYIIVQMVGSIVGVVLARWMFDLSVSSSSLPAVGTSGLWVSEALATCGLVVSVLAANQYASRHVAAIVAAYVAATFYCLPLSIANPAAAVARSMTDTMFGVSRADLAAVLLMQLIGAIVGLAVARGLLRRVDPQMDNPLLVRVANHRRRSELT